MAIGHGYHNVSQTTENDAIRAKNGTPLSSRVFNASSSLKSLLPTQNTHMIRNQAIQRVTNAHIGHQKHKPTGARRMCAY